MVRRQKTDDRRRKSKRSGDTALAEKEVGSIFLRTSIRMTLLRYHSASSGITTEGKAAKQMTIDL